MVLNSSKFLDIFNLSQRFDISYNNGLWLYWHLKSSWFSKLLDAFNLWANRSFVILTDLPIAQIFKVI